MESSPPESYDVKAAFRKPSNDAASRNYRKSSPIDGSSSSDVDRENDLTSSPKYARDDPVKGRDYRERKKDDEKNLSRDSNRSHYGKSGESYRDSERQTSRSSDTHSRHDDPRRRDGDHSKSRDYVRDRDKHSRDKYESISYRSKDREKETSSVEHQKYRDKESHRSDSGKKKSNFEELERDRNDRRDDWGERREYHRSSRDHRSGWGKEESKGSTGGRERDSQKLLKEKRGFQDSGEDQFDRQTRKPLDDKSVFEGNQNSPTKKQRLFSSDGGSESAKDVDGGRQQSQEVNNKANSAKTNASVTEVANDLNAAKFAAMRAAELVNMNLSGGTGYMSTEQKKKLLWGSKKSTPTEESTRQWDVSMIADPERQEKFNKLMSLRLCWYLWPIVGCEGRCEIFGAEAWKRRWEQPNPSREAAGAAVESREAVHCWAPKKGWQNCWFGPLGICFKPLTHDSLLHTLMGPPSLGFGLMDVHDKTGLMDVHDNATRGCKLLHIRGAGSLDECRSCLNTGVVNAIEKIC